MRLIVDENIPFGKEAFENFGDVELHAGREVNAESCRDVDALVVRSITKVNESLLKDSSVKFVGTTTIGTDHIDKEYLKKENISFSSAPGCNSYSVAEYVFSAIAFSVNKHNLNLKNLSIGVVGYGNIGKKVVAIAQSIGMKVIVCDPPLQRSTKQREFSTLKETLKCDIITFHVPLNRDGVDKTLHLLDEESLKIIKPNAILINSSRGPVVSNDALKKRLQKSNDIHAIIDVWESEPDYDVELLELVEIATPHIAGYSFEGKVNGTLMIYDALSKLTNSSHSYKPKFPQIENPEILLDEKESLESLLLKLFICSYDIMEDDKLIRESAKLPLQERKKQFDKLRKTYRVRRELSNFSTTLNSYNERYRAVLEQLRVT